jgi:lipopolysaccharide transport system permease protein
MSVLESFWRHRELVAQLASRDVLGRYRGSILGLLWSFFYPLFMLTIYTFVFGFIFRARGGGGGGTGGGGTAEFALFMFAGLIVYGLFSEVVNRAPAVILSNVNYVKKVVFPLEVLPLVITSSALFHMVISMSVLLMFFFAIHLYLPYTIIFLPLILAPLVLVTLGIAWFLASLGVYVRDVSQTVGILTSALLFLSPIFYPASALPDAVRTYLYLNPLAFIIEQTRQVLMVGEMPNWSGWVLYSAVSVVIAAAGFYWFQKTRRGFADVL